MEQFFDNVTVRLPNGGEVLYTNAQVQLLGGDRLVVSGGVRNPGAPIDPNYPFVPGEPYTLVNINQGLSLNGYFNHYRPQGGSLFRV